MALANLNNFLAALLHNHDGVSRIYGILKTDVDTRVARGMPGPSQHRRQDFLTLFQVEVLVDTYCNSLHVFLHE